MRCYNVAMLGIGPEGLLFLLVPAAVVVAVIWLLVRRAKRR
jgi:hypothetical protein